MIYRFRRDWQVIICTLLVVALMGYAIYDVFQHSDKVFERVMIAIVWIPIIIIMLRTPRYFYIEKDLIVVKRFIGSKVIEDIRAIRPLTKEDMRRTTKSWGNDGLMGYTGYFQNKQIGYFQMLAVNKKELALVTLANGKQYVINYPGELLEKWQEESNRRN